MTAQLVIKSDLTKSRMAEFLNNHPVVKSFVAGSLSGACSSILFQPLDLVKTRLQQAPAPCTVDAPIGASTGMFNIFGSIVREERVVGLWRGMVPTLTRCVPGVGMYFASLEYLKISVASEKPSALETVILGIGARSISGVCMIPATVVKTRFESGVYQYRSVFQALTVIYRTEGVRGLSCGLVPTLFRDAPFSGLYLMFYTQTKAVIPESLWDSQLTAPLHFTCGIIAGLLASITTQPADVIKTKMQLYPEKFNTVHEVVIYVYKKYGMKGYFKGLVPRIVRRSLMAAMTWTVYEQVTRSIGLH